MRNLPQSPLLLQPVVGTNDRPHTKLNENYYASKSVPGHIAPSNIIEIMLPMIDSAFLVWFSNFFIKKQVLKVLEGLATVGYGPTSLKIIHFSMAFSVFSSKTNENHTFFNGLLRLFIKNQRN